jgi:hypothetical protein
LVTNQFNPTRIVGVGCKYPRAVASAWIRKSVFNELNPNNKVTKIFVMSNGDAFTTRKEAMQSQVFRDIKSGNFQTPKNTVINDYGVIPATCTDGFMIYTTTKTKER